MTAGGSGGSGSYEYDRLNRMTAASGPGGDAGGHQLDLAEVSGGPVAQDEVEPRPPGHLLEPDLDSALPPLN